MDESEKWGVSLEQWQQMAIEGLTIGDSWRGEHFCVHRYKDGWHFLWVYLLRGFSDGSDLGRFFNEDHIWDMRNFMSGKWTRGAKITCPDLPK